MSLSRITLTLSASIVLLGGVFACSDDTSSSGSGGSGAGSSSTSASGGAGTGAGYVEHDERLGWSRPRWRRHGWWHRRAPARGSWPVGTTCQQGLPVRRRPRQRQRRPHRLGGPRLSAPLRQLRGQPRDGRAGCDQERPARWTASSTPTAARATTTATGTTAATRSRPRRITTRSPKKARSAPTSASNASHPPARQLTCDQMFAAQPTRVTTTASRSRPTAATASAAASSPGRSDAGVPRLLGREAAPRKCTSTSSTTRPSVTPARRWSRVSTTASPASLCRQASPGSGLQSGGTGGGGQGGSAARASSAPPASRSAACPARLLAQRASACNTGCCYAVPS
jgi:hypothetical protein